MCIVGRGFDVQPCTGFIAYGLKHGLDVLVIKPVSDGVEDDVHGVLRCLCTDNEFFHECGDPTTGGRHNGEMHAPSERLFFGWDGRS